MLPSSLLRKLALHAATHRRGAMLHSAEHSLLRLFPAARLSSQSPGTDDSVGGSGG